MDLMGHASGLRDLFLRAEFEDRGRVETSVPVAFFTRGSIDLYPLYPRAESPKVPKGNSQLSYPKFQLCWVCPGEADTINLQSPQVWWRHYC